MPQHGLWYDGQVALERRVEVVAEPPGLMLLDENGCRHPVDASQLVRLDCAKGQYRFGHRSLDGWRLVLTEPLEPGIVAVLPARTGSLGPAIGRRKLVVLVGLCATATAAAGLFILAPEYVARHMPMSWERKLGAAYDVPIGWALCRDAEGQAALNRLVDRLDPKARGDGLRLELVDVGTANAVALPGGRMLLFEGLLDDAGSGDAIAGIVAHEIAHIRRRHVASAMVRQMGLGTVVTVLGGGALAGGAGDLLSLRFSRENESVADRDAVATLKAAEIDPRPTARLFKKFAGSELAGSDYAAEFLSSHPLSIGRAGQFATAHNPLVSYRPALSADQYTKLRQACDRPAKTIDDR